MDGESGQVSELPKDNPIFIYFVWRTFVCVSGNSSSALHKRRCSPWEQPLPSPSLRWNSLSGSVLLEGSACSRHFVVELCIEGFGVLRGHLQQYLQPVSNQTPTAQPRTVRDQDMHLELCTANPNSQREPGCIFHSKDVGGYWSN